MVYNINVKEICGRCPPQLEMKATPGQKTIHYYGQQPSKQKEL
jgi:hypothetical protein